MENKEMIDELYLCAAQCTRCYDACRMEKDKTELELCMRIDEDCADVCRLAGQWLERNSVNSELLLKLCAELCEKCAAECDKHSDLEHCKTCAQACRKCAKICTQEEVEVEHIE